MANIEIKVPDIGDFHDVPVIEVLVKVGDQVEKEQPLLVLESDKATMEVPSDTAGTIVSLAVSVGDKINQGMVIATITAAEGAAPAAKPSPTASPTPTISKAPALTMKDVAANNTAKSCWSAIDGNVYDLTRWINSHPGGSSAITFLCGTDGSKAFAAQTGRCCCLVIPPWRPSGPARRPDRNSPRQGR